MINIEQIKEYIKCPQFGDLEYGKWGALRLEQRVAYKELIEEIERLKLIIATAIRIYEDCEETQDYSTCDLDMYEVLKEV